MGLVFTNRSNCLCPAEFYSPRWHHYSIPAKHRALSWMTTLYWGASLTWICDGHESQKLPIHMLPVLLITLFSTPSLGVFACSEQVFNRPKLNREQRWLWLLASLGTSQVSFDSDAINVRYDAAAQSMSYLRVSLLTFRNFFSRQEDANAPNSPRSATLSRNTPCSW